MNHLMAVFGFSLAPDMIRVSELLAQQVNGEQKVKHTTTLWITCNKLLKKAESPHYHGPSGLA